ncbi:MAG: cytidine deaminase [Bacteroidetes bacterium]|nr:cytidine deaminase [Bacteroidota bacterium]MCW5894515.1 cytidine deaminase [Bacteroidota bacterium]
MRKPKLSATKQKHLIRIAKLAKENSYSPYSKFRVGAALLAGNGRIFSGCNVENSSYSLTTCAERNALFKAVSEGSTDFISIAIASDDTGLLPPCGACRQVLSEFAPDIEVILTSSQGDVKLTSLKKLFPMPADLKKLGSRASKQ